MNEVTQADFALGETEAAPASEFESEAAAIKEDKLRARQIRRALPTPGPTGWLNYKDRAWLRSQSAGFRRQPALDVKAAKDLAKKLQDGADTGFHPQTLASSLAVRVIRRSVIGGLLTAVADYANDDLKTFTVINLQWQLTPEQLEQVTAKQIKNQFISHLRRSGVMATPGFLLAFLHGEFEPTSGMFVLHFHGITTREKAAALKGLKGRCGYVPTRTKARPIVVKRVNDRVRQFTYLLKAYWPQKAVRTVGGKQKRDREPKRISERFHTQYLIWLDRQRLADMTVFTGGWSRRNGGTASMRDLYLSIYGRG